MDLERTIAEASGLIPKLRQLGKRPNCDVPILTAKLKLTWKCNLACTFCSLPKSREMLDTATVIPLIDSLKARGLEKIHLSGGEVLLHPGLFDIVEHAASTGVQVNLTTNGTLLTKASAKALRNAGVHSVSLSIDAGEPRLHDKLRNKKGAFDKTVAGIEQLAKFGGKKPKIRVNTVVGAVNYHTLDGLHEKLLSISETIHWRLIPIDTEKRRQRLSPEMTAELLKTAERFKLLEDRWLLASLRKDRKFQKGEYAGGYYDTHLCYMPWIHLFVDPAGYVYPCCMTRGQISAMGNIHQETIDDILGGSAMQSLRMSFVDTWRRQSGPPLDVCSRCDDFLKENYIISRQLKAGG